MNTDNACAPYIQGRPPGSHDRGMGELTIAEINPGFFQAFSCRPGKAEDVFPGHFDVDDA